MNKVKKGKPQPLEKEHARLKLHLCFGLNLDLYGGQIKAIHFTN